MVRHREEFPERGELVIAKVKRVTPYSALVSLEEYPGKEGMIHISEVARKWVRDIREFVKEGRKVVVLVMRIDKEKGHIGLSLKRVSRNEQDARLREWKREQKAEKMLNSAARKMDKDLDKAYEEVGFLLQDKFGEMFKAFKIALQENGLQQLTKRGVPEEWAKVIKDIAEEQMELKEIELKSVLELTSNDPKGSEIIKKVLNGVEKKYDVVIRYIAAPKYSVVMKTKDVKKGEKKLTEALETAVKEIEKKGGEGKYEIK